MIVDTGPKCRRFVRGNSDFDICVNIGQKGYVVAEHPDIRWTTHYIGIYGSGRFGRIFEEDYIVFDELKVYDVTDYVKDKVIFEALEDFYLIGFNTHDKDVKWEGKLLEGKPRKITVDKKTVLINLNRPPIHVNDKKFKRFDYTYLEAGREYKLALPKDHITALFHKS